MNTGPVRAKLHQLLESGLRLPVAELECPDGYASMTQACFQEQSARPTFDELLEQLTLMLQQVGNLTNRAVHGLS